MQLRDMTDLVSLLRAKQMNRSDLARALNVNKATVTRWAQGEIPPERLAEVSEATGIPARELRPDLAEAFDEQPDRAAREGSAA